MIPNILSIAGSDCSGGAGIQADIKAISANGGYAMSVITALTAQNTQGVRSVHLAPLPMIADQIAAIRDDITIHAVKIGMLGTAGIVRCVAEGLAADFLLVDLNRPEFTPSHDLPWELVRYGNRDQIDAVFTQGQLRLWKGWPVDWDARALMDEVRALTAEAIAGAGIRRVHPTATEHRDRSRA